MGTYNFGFDGLPLTSGGGTTSQDAFQFAIPGNWTSGELLSASGVYTGTGHPTIGIICEGVTGQSPREEFLGVNASGGVWTASNLALAIIPTYFSFKKSIKIRFDASAWSSNTLQSFSFSLTGTPSPILPTRSVAPAMGGLFFLNPTYTEPSLGGPNTPPTYPDPQFNFPQYEDTFSPYPSGGLRSKAKEGNDRQGNRGKMSCLVPKQNVYLTIPGNLTLPQNFPIMVILDYPNTTAQWLKWDPGLYNQNGTPGQIEARIYQGNPGSAQPGIWVPSVGLTNLRPVWVGQGSYSDLIPWGGQPMQLVIELAGISNIPAGSFFDAVLEGFDSD